MDHDNLELNIPRLCDNCAGTLHINTDTGELVLTCIYCGTVNP